MKLRDTIRPPVRFDAEQLNTPLQRPLREPITRKAPRYIDYDPNLPPAVFPTIERPHTTHSHLNESKPAGLGRSDDDREKEQWNENSGDIGPCNGQAKESWEMLEDVSMDFLENLIISNGNMNSIYVRNMTEMSKAGQMPSIVMAMEDSDPDEAIADVDMQGTKSVSIISDPQWCNLSPKIQVEIAENMMKHFNWAATCNKLGLSAREREELQEYMKRRDAQIELENVELDAMRAKQLRALLRVDNSSERRKRIPHKLVFRRTSRQTTRRLLGHVETDYFLCDAGEILNARRFLGKQGLNRRYAGEWSSSIFTMQSAQDRSKPYALRVGDGAVVPARASPMRLRQIILPDRVLRSANHKRLASNFSRQQVDHGTGVPDSNGLGQTQLQNQERNASARTLYCPRPGSRQLIIRLKIGRLRAALFREWECFVHPQRLMRSFPSLDVFFLSSNQSERDDGNTTPITTLPTSPTQSALNNFTQSLRGAIDENLALNSSELDQMSLLASWTSYRQRLEQAEFYSSSSDTGERSDVDMMDEGGSRVTVAKQRSYNAYATPSRSTTPSRFMPPHRSEGFYTENLAPFSETKPARAVSVFESPRSNIWEGFSNPEGNRSPMTPVSSVTTVVEMFKDKPIDRIDDEWEEEVEEGDEDEMVLVPASRPMASPR